MDKELRTEFESLFLAKLRAFCATTAHVKARKNVLTFLDEDKNAVAEIALDHIGKAGGYALTGVVFGGAPCSFVHDATPPYRNNIPFHVKKPCLFYLSQNEKRKEFSDVTGGIQSCRKKEDMDAFCDRMFERIQRYQIPRIMNCLHGLPGLFEDIARYPDEYNHPFILTVYAAERQGLFFDSEFIQTALKSRKICGNKAFDTEFARKMLR